MKSEVEFIRQGVRIARVFDAPRQLLFDCWKDPGKLQQWSGCKDARNVQCEADFRAGGAFRQTMEVHGTTCVITGEYEEIVEPERIVYSANLGPATVRVTIEFIAEGDRTKVVMTQTGFPDENLPKIVAQGTGEGLDKLELGLTEIAAAKL